MDPVEVETLGEPRRSHGEASRSPIEILLNACANENDIKELLAQKHCWRFYIVIICFMSGD